MYYILSSNKKRFNKARKGESNMPSYIEALGQGAGAQGASTLVGNIFGLAMEKHNDKRQLKQQKKLSQQQMEFDKMMADYNYGKQMDMWNATNYKAQMQQLEKAGLNPALLYGMSGGGGVTTGSGGGGGVHAPSAPSGGGEVMGVMNQAMNAQLMGAQIEVMKSQAKKNEAEATATSGVDTQLKETQIQSLTQGIDNQKAQQKLTEIQADIAEYEKEIKGETLQASIKMMKYQTNKALQELNILENEAFINENTRAEKMGIIQEELAGIVARNELTRAQTTQTKEQTDQLAKQIALEYSKLSNLKDNTEIQRKLQEFQTSFGGQAGSILGALLKIIPGVK